MRVYITRFIAQCQSVCYCSRECIGNYRVQKPNSHLPVTFARQFDRACLITGIAGRHHGRQGLRSISPATSSREFGDDFRIVSASQFFRSVYVMSQHFTPKFNASAPLGIRHRNRSGLLLYRLWLKGKKRVFMRSMYRRYLSRYRVNVDGLRIADYLRGRTNVKSLYRAPV